MVFKKIRIGTRGSPLALLQTELIKQKILRAYPTFSEENIHIQVIRTQGDKITDKSLADIGGKGLFCKEIDAAVLRGDIDCAVHSAKDLESTLPEHIHIIATPVRDDPWDALVSTHYNSLDALPENAIIGTASVRRAAQLKQHRPDLRIRLLRGNVHMRLKKITHGEFDATVLAYAGLKRLGLTHYSKKIFSAAEMVPAVGQGTLAVCGLQKPELSAFFQPIHNDGIGKCLLAERTMLKLLDGSCHTPIGGYATHEKGLFELEGILCSEDGTKCARYKDTHPDPEILGKKVALHLKASFS